MNKSALNLATEEAPALIESTPPVQKLDVSKIIVYEPARRPAPFAKISSGKERRRKKKLVRFIKLEAAAFFLLILMLAGATNERLQRAGFGTLFETGMVVAALVVAIIPVLFYGSTREKYRYRTRRYRSR